MKKFLLLIALIISGVGIVSAQSTIIDYEGYSLKFTVTNVEPAECEVVLYSGESFSIVIPSSLTINGIQFSVTSIGNSAFSICSSLTSIEIPNSVTSIGEYAFASCSSLTSIEIPNSVTSIGKYAFEDCSSLTSIEIPNSIAYIGNYAFSACSSLTSIKCRAISVPYIGVDVFPDGSEIMVPFTSVKLYKSDSAWNRYNITAYNITIDYNGFSLKFTITSDSPAKCEVDCVSYPPTTLTALTIPSAVIIDEKEYTVTSIANNAFYECKSLMSVDFEDNSMLNTIGEAAFYGCSNLNSIEIPASVTSLLSQTAEEYDDFGMDYIKNIVYYGTFENCTKLKSVVFGDNSVLTSIGDEAFRGCNNLIYIDLPNSLQNIGAAAFCGCSSLKSIVIPNGVASLLPSFVENRIYHEEHYDNYGNWYNSWIEDVTIYYGTFENCSNLTCVTFSDYYQLFTIGHNTFKNCHNLTSMKCHAMTVPSTSSSAFSGCPTYNMTIQVPAESVNSYRSSSPWNNYNIISGFNSTIILDSNIENGGIVSGSGTYQDNTSITVTATPSIGYNFENWTENDVIVSEDIEYNFIVNNDRNLVANFVEDPDILGVGNNTVINYDGYSLKYIVTNVSPAECNVYCITRPTVNTSITIPPSVVMKGVECSVTSIRQEAFYGCKNLIGIEIPNSVTSIGECAFENCYNLASIEIPNSVTSIGECAFAECSNLESIIVESGNPIFDSRNNCNAIIETSTNTLLGGCMNTIIPNDIVVIGKCAFSHRSSLTSMEIPNSVTSIENCAFSGCSNLSNIKFAEGSQLTYIGSESFTGCSSLTSINIPNSVSYIGGAAFMSCSNLTGFIIPNSITSLSPSIFFGCSNLKNIEIPNSITSIESMAFVSCSSLTSIKIPKNVTSVGWHCFYNCPNLSTIKCYAESVPATDYDAFDGCPSNMTIYVPETSVNAYETAEPWNHYNIEALVINNYTINITSNISEAGTVSGSGSYQEDTSVTVTATPNEGYVFKNWTENGIIVSINKNYTFTVSGDRNLIANFSPVHWNPDETLYPNNMTITAVVQLDGVEQRTADIEVGAFCGGELRGSNILKYEGGGLDRYFLYLTVYGEAGDRISFKIYDHATASESDLYCNGTINFVVNGNVGDIINPKILNFVSHVTHERQLTANWNWYSTYINMNGDEGFGMITNKLGGMAEQLKSQIAFTNYYPELGWYGALETVDSKEMYMIDMSEPMVLEMTGSMINPEEFPITLTTNWRWISYPLTEEMDVTEALSNITPNDGDYIKSQSGFAQYFTGLGWRGSLSTMTPGYGYMYQNTSGTEKTLYYPTHSESKTELKANVTTENNYWKPEVSKYPTNMSVIAVVDFDFDSDTDFEIAAFCDGECRGSARPIYIEELDRNIIFLTIYGKDEETIYFKYYDVNDREEYNVYNTIIYGVDATIGTIINPYAINLAPENVNEISENELYIYPNPVNKNTEIHFATECDRVEVYNALGVKIAEYENVDHIDGIETSGIYMIKVIKEGVIKYERIVVK